MGEEFGNALHIAKHGLRIRAADFKAAVSVLNTRISRVINTCPGGKDTRDLPQFMRITAEELRLSYSLLTPNEATKFVSEKGSMWGYFASEIALAKQDHRAPEQARVARRHAEDLA